MRMMHPLRPRGLVALAAIVAAASAAWADSKPLARYVPKDDLIVYAEFSGLDAHAEAWRKTATYTMLRETGAGAMLEEVLAQTIDAALASAPEGQRPTGKQVVAAIEWWARSGFAVGINGKLAPGVTPRVVEVFRGAGGPEVGKGTRQLLDLLTKASGPSEVVTREDGRKVTYAKPRPGQPDGTSAAWWFEGDDLVLVVPGGEAEVEAIVETLAGKRPSAVDAPIRAELDKATADGFEPVFVSYADLTNLPPTPPMLGLSGLKRIDARWGFQGPMLVGITRVQAPSPRKGLLALLDQPTFGKADALPVPIGLKDYTILSVDPGKLFDGLVDLAKQADPNAEPAIKMYLEAARNALGVPVREELLGQLGPMMAFYVAPQPTTISVNPYMSIGEWMLHPPQVTAVVGVRDPARFARTLDTLADVANRQLAAAMSGSVPAGGEAKLNRLNGDAKGYTLDLPLGTFPLPSGIRPTILLGEKYLAIAVSPQAARKALEFERAKSTGPAPETRDLPGGLIALNVNDPSAYVPDLLANVPFAVEAIAKLSASNGPGTSPIAGLRLTLDPDAIPTADRIKPYLTPGTVSVSVDDQGVTFTSRDSVPSFNPMAAGPVGVALLLPAVQAAREAARRSQSVNNLKQIMLAYHNFHSTNNTFPPAAICDAEGKPLLSWRVAILPFIEQQDLYNQFHLDEPWDSAHNKPLLEKMPQVYRSPKAKPNDTTTFYQAFVGDGALYDAPSKAPGIAEITDGTSNTLAVVEAGKAVPWSKPEDIPFARDKDLPKLGGLGFPGGFNAGFCDGSVRFLKFSINKDTLKALITRAGGEVISSDSY